MSGFFEGVQVVDLTQGIAGPMCTKMLADWGANVIKIERPAEGDAARHWGPFVGDEAGLDRSLMFLYLNTNKRSVTLNLNVPRAREVLDELVRSADIVVQSYEPSTAERFGLTYERVSQVNPGVVMVSISSFGQAGPYRDYESTKLVEYALSGLLYHIGAHDREPVVHGTPQAEYMAAFNAATGAMAALLHREASGEGQHVDVAIAESLSMTLAATELSAYAYLGGVSRRMPHRPNAGIDINQVLECADGYIAPIPGARWADFANFLEAPELLEAPFVNPAERTQHVEEAVAIIRKHVATKNRYDLFHGAQALGLAFGLVQTMADIAECPQLEDRDYWVEVEHPAAGHLRYPGVPFRPSRSTAVAPLPAPSLGEHNREVLEDLLGHRLDDLERAGVLAP